MLEGALEVANGHRASATPLQSPVHKLACISVMDRVKVLSSGDTLPQTCSRQRVDCLCCKSIVFAQSTWVVAIHSHKAL